MNLKNQELIEIRGGSTAISGTLLNSIARMIESVMDVGRSLGTAIRMIYSNKTCG